MFESPKELTLDELAEITKRSVDATLGPWLKGEGSDNAIYAFVEPDDFEPLINYADGQFFERADAEFSAHAYRDIQKLLSEVQRLRPLANAAPAMLDFLERLDDAEMFSGQQENELKAIIATARGEG